jgi:CheY-like chemotaxis protein
VHSPTTRILVIEDNFDIATLLRSVLSSHDYHVDLADDLSALHASREHLPDLILTDLLMPRMGGDEAVRRLRASPETRDIPVVLMSASHDLVQRAAELGVAGYLSKPFDLDDLLNVVRRALATTAAADY